MLTTIASFLITRGVPMRWAKPLIYVVLAVLLIVGVGVAKCAYDAAVISEHEAERAAIVERSARQASEGTTAKSDTAREQGALRQAEIADRTSVEWGKRVYVGIEQRDSGDI